MKILQTLIMLFIGVTGLGQTQINGYIQDQVTGAPLKGTRVTLLVIDSIKFHPGGDYMVGPHKLTNPSWYDTIYKRIKLTYTDSNGYYLLAGIDPGNYILRAFHPLKERPRWGWEGESIEKKTIFTRDECYVTISLKIPVICQYESTKNIEYCPKCKMTDKVLKILNGLPRYDPKYPDGMNPNYYYTGDCSPPRCHPTKICLRCKHEF